MAHCPRTVRKEYESHSRQCIACLTLSLDVYLLRLCGILHVQTARVWRTRSLLALNRVARRSRTVLMHVPLTLCVPIAWPCMRTTHHGLGPHGWLSQRVSLRRHNPRRATASVPCPSVAFCSASHCRPQSCVSVNALGSVGTGLS